MLQNKLSTTVKAVRFPYAVLFVLLLAAFYLLVIQPWMTNWGSTAAEQQMVLPGDDLMPAGAAHTTQAVSILPNGFCWQPCSGFHGSSRRRTCC